jgi:hypothetical protein
MNQPIKTVLPAEIKALLTEARSALTQSVIDKISAQYTHNDGTLDPVASIVIEHINCLKSALDAVDMLLETPELKRFVGSSLYGAVHLCIALKQCAAPINDEEVIFVAEALKDIIGELMGSI